MTDPDSPRAGGSLVALCVIAGAVIGVAFRQTSIGILVGAAVGAALAIWVWRHDRKRRG